MSNPSEIEYYAERMRQTISRTARKIRSGEGAAFEKAEILAMWKELIRDGSRMIEDCSGKSDMLARSDDSIRDDIDEAFEDLIAQEEQASEDARDEYLREASSADYRRKADRETEAA